jgi:hypothetical protein
MAAMHQNLTYIDPFPAAAQRRFHGLPGTNDRNTAHVGGDQQALVNGRGRGLNRLRPRWE